MPRSDLAQLSKRATRISGHLPRTRVAIVLGVAFFSLFAVDELLRQRGRSFTIHFFDPHRFPPDNAAVARRANVRDTNRDTTRRLQFRVERAARSLSNSARRRTR